MITLFAMTQKGHYVLKCLIDQMGSSFVSKVVSSSDISVKDDYFDQISLLCSQHKIKFESRSKENSIPTKFAFAVSWRWILPCAEKKLVVFHDSLLPKYRGFAPLINALINKEQEVGVTALWADSEYDKGPIIAQKKLAIQYPKKIGELIGEVSQLYGELAVEIAKEIQTGMEISSQAQDETCASYSLWRDDRDYLIDWTQDADTICRFIHALGDPFQGAKTHINGRPYIVGDAETYPDVKIENRHPGKVILKKKDFPVVVCGEGLLTILALTDCTGKNVLPLKRFRVRFQ